METVNAQGMGCAAAGFVAVLFDRLVTRSVITYAEANAILDDAVTLIEGRGETPSISDALEIIEDLRGRLAKHGVR
jgi:hypothetical protein